MLIITDNGPTTIDLTDGQTIGDIADLAGGQPLSTLKVNGTVTPRNTPAALTDSDVLELVDATDYEWPGEYLIGEMGEESPAPSDNDAELPDSLPGDGSGDE